MLFKIRCASAASRTRLVAAALIIALVVLFPSGRALAAERIAVLVSSSETPFEETLSGFQSQLAAQGITADFDIYQLSRSPAKAAQAVEKIRNSDTRLIYALGSIGMDEAVQAVPDIPIVACLVLRPDGFAGLPNATGVGLEFPLTIQFNWLKTILPEAKTVGVLYSPDENGKRVAEAERIAARLGLTLEAREVLSPRDVPSALAALSRRVDALWGLADTMTLSPQLASHILLFAFRNSIPFIGPSDAWTRAGALYSLDWDYRDLGAQCGDMAIRILRGAAPSSIPPESPRTLRYSVNLKTAEQIKIPIPRDIAKKARRVY